MKHLLLISLCFINGLVSQAQSDRGTLTRGTLMLLITDETGHSLTRASVQLVEVERTGMADEQGRVMLFNLSLGTYTALVSHVGYQTRSQKVVVGLATHTYMVVLTELTHQLASVEVQSDPFRTGPKEQSLSISTVNRQFIERNSSGTLVNALQRIPGMNAINTGVGIAKPVIRGLSFNRIIVNDKGIKQEGQQWGADHGLEIDQFEPERVEIVKGPASLLYGSDAMGGVINLLPPAPPAERTLTGTVLGIYRSNNHLLGSSVMLQGRRDNRFFRLRFSSQDFGDYHVPAQTFTYNRYILPIYDKSLKNTAGQERDLTATLGLQKEWGQTSLTVSNFHQRAGLFPGAIGIPREYLLTPDGDPRDINLPRQVTNHLKMILNTVVNRPRQVSEINIGYQLNDRREESLPHAHGQGPTPAGDLALGLQLQTYSVNLKIQRQPTTNWRSYYGGQGQYQLNHKSGFEFLLPDFRSANVGAFTYQEYDLPSHLTLNGGVRLDYGYRAIDAYQAPIYADSVTISGYMLKNGTINRSFYNASGALGLSYYPSERVNIKVNLGSSFRMPTAPELSSNGIHHGTFRHEMGDSSLTSERGYQLDLTLTYRHQGWLLNLSPFATLINHYIYLRPTAQFSPLPDGGQLYQYQQADARLLGTEAQIDYQFPRKWRIATALSYVSNRNRQTKLPLPFTPPLWVSGEVEYGFKPLGPVTGLFIELYGKWVAAQNQVDRNELATPGYWLLNLTAGSQLRLGSQSFHWLVSVQNVLDTTYLNHLSRYRLLNLPEPSRNISVTLKVPLVLVVPKN